MAAQKQGRRKYQAVWIFTLSIFIIAIALGVGLAWREDYAYPVLWRGSLQGTGGEALGSGWHALAEGYVQPGEPQRLEIPLGASDQERFLLVEPALQRCLGMPDLHIEFRLEDPYGKVIAENLAENAIKGSGSFENCHYRKQINFLAPISGTYRLTTTLYDWGISGVTLSIRERR